MSSNGYTLIETLVALLVGVSMVVAIAVLGQNLIRHRANADSNSAATSLVQMKLEMLKNLPTSHADLTAGTHPNVPESIFEDGQTGVGAPFTRQWVVEDDAPFLGSKKVTVTVTHHNNPFVRAEVQTYLLVTP